MIIVYDPSGAFTFVNHKFSPLTGYSIDEARDLHVAEAIHPDDLALVKDKMRRGDEVPERARHLPAVHRLRLREERLEDVVGQ